MSASVPVTTKAPAPARAPLPVAHPGPAPHHALLTALREAAAAALIALIVAVPLVGFETVQVSSGLS